MNKDSAFEYLKTNLEQFFGFMKEKYPFFNKSNVFFRDLQYGVKNFFERKSVKLTYKDVEETTSMLIEMLEKDGTLSKVNDNAWKLNYAPKAEPEAEEENKPTGEAKPGEGKQENA
ncbi:MAG: hypothetical protein HF314_01855 [Ignavibacteria bacterium]|jgi:hypothetical protein|nr:hypothetical protein [Ignavibacteria bacterium]MCU7501788.1 hypothetical protein [Ignavibacteria bacterium]MCU7518291.1 hypothetical protein [Ignavibacteria bacterium]